MLIYLVVAGTTNAVNLTDGLDGLAAGCAAIVLLAYIGITFITNGQDDLALLCGCLVGACVGFLWFNAFPATIFMGDTGSLGLGGAIAGLAVMTRTEILLVLLGGIFVVEALSVLIQVFSFQTFRKRVFLMAPIHHHFELMAWSETKIILRFWIVAARLRGDRLHDLPAVDLLSLRRRSAAAPALCRGAVVGHARAPDTARAGARCSPDAPRPVARSTRGSPLGPGAAALRPGARRRSTARVGALEGMRCVIKSPGVPQTRR